MKWAELLSELNARSVQLSVSDGELVVRAPQGLLSPELRRYITEYKSSLLQLLELNSEEKPNPKWSQIIPRPHRRHEPFPLTPIQEAYWLGRNPAFELGRVGIHIYEELHCRFLDLDRLQRAWQEILTRHEMLRAVVLPDGRQQILFGPETSIEIRDFRVLSADAKAEKLLELRRQLVQRVYDPLVFPLFTLCACLLDENETRLFISIDALNIDMGSFAVLFSEWSDLYENPEQKLPPLELSFRDYALAVGELRRHESFQEARRYWQRQLADLPPAPALSYACRFKSLKTQTFVRHSGRLKKDAWQRIKQKAARTGITPSGVTLAAMAEVIAKWSREPSFALNLTLFNRLPLHPEVNRIVGDFTSMLPLPVYANDGANFAERAAVWQKRVWEGLEHRIVSGVEVLREFKRSRRQGDSGQVYLPVVFTSTLNLSPQGVLPLKKFGERIFNRIQTPQVSLDLQVYEEEDDLIYNWDGVDELFPSGMLEQMFTAYGRLLERLADEPDVWTANDREIVIYSPPDWQKRLNDTDGEVPAGTLTDLFAEQAARRPRHPALISSRLNLTYEQLFCRSARIGHWLARNGCAPENIVAVIMEKGWEQIVAVWGIIQAGSAYLPLDPNTPPERLLALLAEADVKIVLTQSWLVEKLNLPSGLRVLAITPETASEQPATTPEAGQKQENLAYVLYTSGSTGSPKGVMIEQRSVINRMLDVNKRFKIEPDDKVIALTALHHDLSVFDVFGAILAGATVVVPERSVDKDPAGWASLIAEQKVTVWNSVPAFLEMLLEYLDETPDRHRSLQSLGLLMLSGDWIPLSLPGRWRAVNPETRLISLGGPTETTVWDICYPVSELDPSWRSIPYGRPMANAQYYILNERSEPCPEGVIGEICIGGIGLARGYWRDEKKTREKFISHPRTGQRLYRSGDLGRYHAAGYIEIIGRKDLQLKINGWRIEPGEIEETLKQFPSVRQAVVLPLRQSGRNTGLTAVLVTGPESKNGKVHDHGASSQTAVHAAPSFYNPSRTKLKDCEQTLFKLDAPGRRRDLESDRKIALRLPGRERELEAKYGRRRSVRKFSAEIVSKNRLSDLLGCLYAFKKPDSIAPKFLYPSAGNLQPVQCYVYVHENRVAGLAAGTYYYHPEQHSLIFLSDEKLPSHCHLPHNAGIAGQAAFSLFLIGELSAIEPIYGDLAPNFCLIEAGCMTQLLMGEAAAYGLGLCPIGDLDFPAIRHHFRLNETHLFLHCLLGGVPAAEAFVTSSGHPENGRLPAGHSIDKCAARETPEQRLTELKTFLSARLPAHLIPQNFVFLDSLPLNANGKVDRRALSEMLSSQPVSSRQISPRWAAPDGALERMLVEIWREILAVEEISVKANWGEMGADSIHLVRALNRLRQKVDREVSITDLFRYPNVRALAGFLESEAPDRQTLSRGEQRAALRKELRKRRNGESANGFDEDSQRG